MTLHPNPSTSKVTVNYALNRQGAAELNLMDITGKEVMNVPINDNTPGNNSLVIDVRILPDGFYLVRLSSANGSIVKHLEVMH